jgi:N-acetylneuraminic acid mutarotase
MTRSGRSHLALCAALAAGLALLPGAVPRATACAGLHLSAASAELLVGAIDLELAAGDPWTSLQPMPIRVSEFSTAVIGGLVYAVGGFQAEHSIALWIYNPGNDSWRRGPDLPVATHHTGVRAVAGKLYAIGGSRSESAVQIFDPASGAWTTGTDMPSARTAPAAAVLDGKIHVMGGSSDINVSDGMSVHEVYDPAIDAWERLAPMPRNSEHVFAETIDGKIYVIGGRTGFGNNDTLQIYDPATDSWALGAPLPIATSGMAVEQLDGAIYVFGGENIPFGKVEVATQRYDPATDSWTLETDMPVGLHGNASAVVGDKIYIFGGSRVAASGGGTDFVLRFDARAGELAAPKRLRAKVLSGNRIRLKWKDRSQGEEAFVVEARTGDGDFEEIATVNGNDKKRKKIVLKGFDPETVYEFRVKARQGARVSPYSNTATVTTGE